MKAQTAERLASGDWIITVARRFLWWTWTERYQGSATVWMNVDTGRRAGGMTESRLSELVWWASSQHALSKTVRNDGEENQVGGAGDDQRCD